MADSPEEVKKHLKLYGIIGAALFVLTFVTVAVATVPALDIGGHGFDTADMWLGLAIACFKMFLVASIFMHLNHEKKAIYWFFYGALFFAAVLIGLFALAFFDPITFDEMMPPAYHESVNH